MLQKSARTKMHIAKTILHQTKEPCPNQNANKGNSDLIFLRNILIALKKIEA